MKLRISILSLLMLLTLTNPMVTMAQDESATLPFPLKWNDDNWNQYWHKGGLCWSEIESEKAFFLQGIRGNWVGSVYTRGIVNFPKGEDVELSFYYKSSCDVTLNFVIDENKNIEKEVYIPASTEYTRASLIFTGGDPSTILIQATPDLGILDRGNIYLRNINLDYPVKDLATVDAQPQFPSRIAVGSDIPVKATFYNNSSLDIRNAVFCYSLDGAQAEKQKYTRTIKPGDYYTFEFDEYAHIATEGEHKLSIWCEVADDGNKGNDRLEVNFTAVSPVAFPFNDLFDNGISNWEAIDGNNDGASWTADINQTQDGSTDGIAYFAAGKMDVYDILFAPPIAMKAGNARVAFYYTSLRGSGNVGLYLLSGTEPDPRYMTAIWSNQAVTNTGWIQAYKYLDIPKDETRYFALLVTGSSDGVAIDNFHLDCEEDLCMDNVLFVEESGFNKTTSPVTLSLFNHGLTPQSNISVCYSINGLDNPVVETISATIAPGQKYNHTFTVPADISMSAKTYTLYGKILTPVGSDLNNDLITGQSLSHYANRTTPYSNDFTDGFEQWKLIRGNRSESKWDFYAIGRLNAYRGTNILGHLKGAGTIDDWAISECIEMPAGDYDVSFFYRTNLHYDTPDFYQNIELKMGTERNPVKLGRSIVRMTNVNVPRVAYRKSTTRIHVDTDGKYYFGFHNFSAANGSDIYIDDFSVVPVTDAIKLPYETSFDDLTIYNPSDHFTKWTITDDNFPYLHVDHSEEIAHYKVAEGLLSTPALAIEAGRNVCVELDYAFITEYEPASLQLLGSGIADPDSFEVISDIPNSNEFSTFKFTIPASDEDNEYYFGVRSNQSLDIKKEVPKICPDVYEIKIKGLKVYYADESGIDYTRYASSNVNIRSNNSHIYVESDEEIRKIETYDIFGKLINSIQCNGYNASFLCENTGLLIVKITTSNGIYSKKIVMPR